MGLIAHEEKETEPGCTGFRIRYGHGAASGCDAGIGETFDPTLVGLAMALDTHADEGPALSGSFGSLGHGGCWVEACFDGDPEEEDTEAERVYGLEDVLRICGELDFGDRREARKFRSAQQRDTVWNGHNHIGCSTYYVDELLARR
jgi:hypothetical protein